MALVEKGSPIRKNSKAKDGLNINVIIRGDLNLTIKA